MLLTYSRVDNKTVFIDFVSGHARQRQKRKAKDNSESIREKLLENLLHQKAVNELLDSEGVATRCGVFSHDDKDDMFALPPLPEKLQSSDSSEEDSDSDIVSAKIDSLCEFQYGTDLNSVDINSQKFKSLPPNVRHEILTEMQATRKQNSWAKIHEMPDDSNDFSKFQLDRLLKRRHVQVSLEEAANEISGKEVTFTELEEMFKKDGMISGSVSGKRIASDEMIHSIYVSTGRKHLNPLVEETQSLNDRPINTKQAETVEKAIFAHNSVPDEITSAECSNQELHMISGIFEKEDDLSQEQILQVIKEQNTPSDQDVKYINWVESKFAEPCNSSISSYSKINISDTYQKLDESTKMDDNEAIKAAQIVDCSNNNIKHDQMTKLNFDYDSDSADTELNGYKTNKLLNNENFETNDRDSSQTEFSDLKGIIFKENKIVGEKIHDESSDSDDLIEVSNENELNNQTEFDTNEVISGHVETSKYFDISRYQSIDTQPAINLEITVKPKDISHNDIFSDVFAPKIEAEKQIERNESLDSSDHPSLNNTELSKNYDTTCNVKADTSAPHKTVDNTFSGEKDDDKTDIFQVTLTDQTEINFQQTALATNTSGMEKTQDPALMNEELLKIQKSLDAKQKVLLQERGKQERLGSTISQQMILEAQELLTLFGIPYVVAPMEAEAQCAFMDEVSLTEGTITDDSDIWLFGGQKVYKNFFDNRKFVLHFRAVDIENFFKLTRKQMIQLAMLVGSDYTVGLDGIGPVTALEILAYFETKSDQEIYEDISNTLKDFRQWIHGTKNINVPLAKKLKGVIISEEFPNTSVINAYLHPTIDDSRDTFSWAIPNLEKLREYARTKFGWKTTKVDEILLPIMKRLMNRNKQRTLEKYFNSKIHIPNELPTISKRVQNAINKLRNQSQMESDSTNEKAKTTKQTNKKRNPKSNVVKTVINSECRTQKLTTGSKIEFIPQRERDHQEAVKRRSEAIRILKSKKQPPIKKANKTPLKSSVCSNLSESSSSDEV